MAEIQTRTVAERDTRHRPVAGTHASAGERGKLWAFLSLLLFAGCKTPRRMEVRSTPPGARVLLDGKDTGRSTPTEVLLDTSVQRYEVTLEKAGYNPARQEIRRSTDVDVIEADELACTVLCSPCCLGLPLLDALDELVTVKTHYHPREVDLRLDLAGQGIKLRVNPPDAEVLIDQVLHRPLESNTYVTSPGFHELEVRAAGHRPYRTTLQIDALTYVEHRVQLEVEGEGLLLSIHPSGARIYVDDQLVTIADSSPVRVRTTPGAHSLRIELESHRTSEDVIQVQSQEYRELTVELARAGQGVIVRPPQGWGGSGVEVWIDQSLAATEFGEPLVLTPGQHSLSIRAQGFEPSELSILVQENQFLEVVPTLGRKNDARR